MLGREDWLTNPLDLQRNLVRPAEQKGLLRKTMWKRELFAQPDLKQEVRD